MIKEDSGKGWLGVRRFWSFACGTHDPTFESSDSASQPFCISLYYGPPRDVLRPGFPTHRRGLCRGAKLHLAKAVVVKLPDEIANKVEVRISLKVRGIASNKVIVKFGRDFMYESISIMNKMWTLCAHRCLPLPT